MEGEEGSQQQQPQPQLVLADDKDNNAYSNPKHWNAGLNLGHVHRPKKPGSRATQRRRNEPVPEYKMLLHLKMQRKKKKKTKMELLKFSKFKLQLQSLITEVRDLRDRERSASQQHHHQIQKQKRNEEECSRKIQELQCELASIKEERQKLERKVNYLQNDNVLLENKQKELKGTLNSLLQSRENFVLAYEESASHMKRSIQTKDRMLSVLSEKINSHLLLFDSIQKEVFDIKQILDKVQNIVTDKEEVVTSLKNKMDWVSQFDKEFVEHITDLRNKLENKDAESRRKDRVISELEAKLDAGKLSNNNHAQIEDLQKKLSAKDAEIQNLISDKEGLRFEVGSLRLILQRFQETITNMNEEDKRLFSSIMQHKEASALDMKIADTRMEDIVQNNEDKAQEPT